MKKEVMFAYGNMLLNTFLCIFHDLTLLLFVVVVRESQLFIVETTRAIIFG